MPFTRVILPSKSAAALLKSVSFLWWAAGLYAFFFLLLYPDALLIADETGYFEQAFMISRGELPFERGIAWHKPYPIGTALWITPFILLFGKWGAFLAGPVALLPALLLTRFFLHLAGFPLYWAALYFLYPPALLLSRQLMSELPSMLVVAAFLALLYSKTRFRAFGLGLLVGSSVLFREANILLLAPFLFAVAVESRGKVAQAGTGLAAGLALRLAAGYWAFGDPFFIKDPNVSFGLQYLPGNLLLYLPALLIFVPGGLWAAWKYKGAYCNALRFALGAYLLLHLLYGYNGCQDSGWRCLVLGPRFFIPALPLFALALAGSRIWEQRLQPQWLAASVGSLAAFSVIIGQVSSHWYGKQQHQLVAQLYQHPEAMNVIEKASYLQFKYVSPLYGSLNYYTFGEAIEMAVECEPVYAHCFLQSHDQTEQSDWQRQLGNGPFTIVDSTITAVTGGPALVTYSLVLK